MTAIERALYRGWDYVHGEWVYGFLMMCASGARHGTHGFTPAIQTFDGEHTEIEFVTAESVGQWTGLTDRNGKRIFEGDVVLVCWYGPEPNKEQHTITDVRSLPKLHGSSVDYCEIIENVYDAREVTREPS